MNFSDLHQDKQALRKLNLGCGHHPKPEFLNVDMSDAYPADLFHDLDEIPWPIPSEHYELVEADHVLEHLTDVRAAVGELERVLVPGGKLVIRVPHFSRGFTHWDHKHGFDCSFMIYFGPTESGGFEGSRLKPVSTRLTWFAQPHVKRKYLRPIPYAASWTLGKIFDFIGNLNLFFTSRFLCYWVGGFDEICFVLRKRD